MSFMDFYKLAEYGVAVVAIGALVYVVTLFARFVRTSQDTILNHISDSTQAIQHLTILITEMKKWLERNNK